MWATNHHLLFWHCGSICGSQQRHFIERNILNRVSEMHVIMKHVIIILSQLRSRSFWIPYWFLFCIFSFLKRILLIVLKVIDAVDGLPRATEYIMNLRDRFYYYEYEHESDLMNVSIFSLLTNSPCLY